MQIFEYLKSNSMTLNSIAFSLTKFDLARLVFSSSLVLSRSTQVEVGIQFGISVEICFDEVEFYSYLILVRSNSILAIRIWSTRYIPTRCGRSDHINSTRYPWFDLTNLLKTQSLITHFDQVGSINIWSSSKVVIIRPCSDGYLDWPSMN